MVFYIKYVTYIEPMITSDYLPKLKMEYYLSVDLSFD